MGAVRVVGFKVFLAQGLHGLGCWGGGACFEGAGILVSS